MLQLPVATERKFALGFAISMVFFSCVCVVSIYTVFWQTWDEPAHIGTGMQWLETGEYKFERFHPPLARIAIALGPYLDGARTEQATNMWTAGDKVLHANGKYERELSLARLGVLPFFIIGALVVFCWSFRLAGWLAAAIATFLYCTLPPILGHAGLATLDVPCMATTCAALFALNIWVEKTDLKRSIMVGLCCACAILTKFSAIGFLAVGFPVIFVLNSESAFANKRDGRFEWLLFGRGSLVAVFVVCLVVWATYRFSSTVGVLSTAKGSHELIDTIAGSTGFLHDWAYTILERFWLPAPEFLYGLDDFRYRDKENYPEFLLGDVRGNGWWYYYPLVFLIKTPLPFIFLCLGASAFLFKEILDGRSHRNEAIPLVLCFAILTVGILGHVDNGIRQLLSIYPLLAVVVGCATTRLMQLNGKYRPLIFSLVTGLLFWQLIASVRAYPDYMAYFNELARAEPEKIVVDSNLDWGQDLKRLSVAVKAQGLTNIAIAYNGSKGLDLAKMGFSSWRTLRAHERTTGWIAISVSLLQLDPEGRYQWLRSYEPKQKVGTSILIYYVAS